MIKKKIGKFVLYLEDDDSTLTIFVILSTIAISPVNRCVIFIFTSLVLY